MHIPVIFCLAQSSMYLKHKAPRTPDGRCSISSCQLNVMFRENHNGLVTSGFIHISVVTALGYIFSGQARAF